MKRIRFLFPLVVSFTLFVALAVFVLAGVKNAQAISDKEGLAAAEKAVRQGVVCYYALEGTYPATYEDLKEYCHLVVDDSKYIVFYEIFASNIMPDITVLERAGYGESS